MPAEMFAARMRCLRTQGFRVVGLEEGVDALQHNSPIADSVVITIDDGFFGTYNYSLGILRELNLPATTYLTTYYSETGTAIFNVLIPYLFWKSDAPSIDLEVVDERLNGTFTLTDSRQRDSAIEALIIFGDGELGPEARQGLAMRAARVLGLDADAIEESRFMELMTAEEVRDAARQGFDIQLHTYRHRFPIEHEAAIEREIADNRRVLERMIGGTFSHFCYPNGEYDPKVWPLMERLGIRSATTCETGLNDSLAAPLGLRRFIDGTDVSEIEFEALMSGLYDL